ncbi:ABC transporter substrate-binding protein [Caenimonas sedimenti]|uniref:ABC transporter substrate-binding protein n=1 Tax=Caenimonas sedimenti TaxID=2596921 RepID=UPI0021056330|nr:ABC transporter substrate-binding protein [Caenimonas sedimenti]
MPAMPRRRVLRRAGAAALGFLGPWSTHHAWAQAKRKRPLLIGLTTDDSGQYAASGQDEQRGIRMAIAEANERGGVLGRQIETVQADTGGDPVKAAGVAQRMVVDQEVNFLIGAVHSGAASAISKLAQQYGVVYLNSNSSSPTEAGKDCHRTKFVWDGNGTNFSTAIVRGAMTGFGRDWVLVTSDYLWGHNTAKGIRAIVEANGGKVIQELIVPQNARDFSEVLKRLAVLKPGVVGTAVGGDDLKALRDQVRKAGLDRGCAWINNQQDWPDVYGTGKDALFGIFGTTWYWALALPGVTQFVERYRAFNPGYRIKVPGNVYYNGYMATRELLRAVERVGTTNNLKVIRELENLRVPARDRMQHHDAWMNPQTHQLQQTI